ncbi:MAG: hypothetical protein EOM67_02360 [Spirochaetia bacterium]|nr:hypothetical protein [Spirochaetia bacterium]
MPMKKYFFGLCFLLSLIIFPISALDTSIIIRSPLYTDTPVMDEALTIDRSFKGQLGLIDEISSNIDTLTNEEKIISAMSQPDYPVTPGDQIRLSYVDSKQIVTTLTLQVNTSYKVSIAPFGEVDGRGKSFEQFRNEISSVVKNYLPFSNPQVSLMNVGSFYITVRGEVKRTMQKPSWGLTRLSHVVMDASDYASTRNIIVTSLNKEEISYDLYAALREGDLTQDPLLKTGDIVTLIPSGTTVSILGEVKREGTYQIGDFSTLSEVITDYAKGVLPSGDNKHYTIRRYDSNNQIQIMSVEASLANTFKVQNYDTILINPLIPQTKAVSIEGAISIQSTQSTNTLSSSGRLYYQFYPGESVQNMLLNMSTKFTAVSDLANMYLKRDGKIIPINAKSILIGESKETNTLILQEGDSFVVPFSQLFVHVAGGVLNPGTYPYIPDKNASYYINAAGGFDPSKNRNGSFSILDKEGNRLDKDVLVPTEAIVTAKVNTFQAVNGMNLATTVTITGLIATVLGIIASVISLTN